MMIKICSKKVIIALGLMSCLVAFSLCFAANQSIISKQIDKATELKEKGDIKGAAFALQELIKNDALKNDSFTKGYVETLMQCLQGDYLTYLTTVRHATKVMQETKSAFLQMYDEIRIAELSRRNLEAITEMRQRVSHALVTHNFCSPPSLEYAKLHEVVLEGLYCYSRAWGSLYSYAFDEKNKDQKKLLAESLVYFRKGNELFTIAGVILQKINE